MKKIVFLMASLAMLIACEKEEGGVQQPNTKVTIGVNQEQIVDAASRVAISENGNKFVLNWEGTEELSVTTSTATAIKSFEQTSANGTSATFTGDLPNAGDVTVTNYYAGVSSFMSRSTSGRNHIRLAIATNQTMNGANVANSCMLVGEMKDCEVGTIADDFSLKTMNAFIKIPVKLGAPAAGATNTYANGMKLQNVKIEAVGGEQLSGRFAIDLEADDWSAAYATNTGLGAEVKSSSVTLACNDLVLSDEAVNLYVAVAFGTYAQGLKVTFNVIGDNDKVGVMEKVIKSSGLTLARNTMLSMPAIPVAPKDVVVEKYVLVDNITELAAGTYYMAGKSSNLYYFATGSLTTTSNKDMITTAGTAYATATGAIDVTDAAEVTIETKDAAQNQYYVKIGDKYLTTTTTLASRRISLAEAATDNPPYWTVANDANRGGIILESSVVQVYLVTASSTTSNVLRTYTSNAGGTDKGVCGVYFFKKVTE